MTIVYRDIEQAAERIRRYALRTPLIESPVLNERVGGRVFIKPESLQRTGSFKFRGAFNRLVQLQGEEKKAGVVAWSSGNHAQGIAAAARILGINAAIVMPQDAPAIKMQSTRDLGAEIITYDRYRESREEIGHRLSRERGAVLVPSYDDPHIMAGQGTAGLEMADQVAGEGITLDRLLVCCGGGGLIAGVSTAFAQQSPATAVYSVEPAGFDDTARSLQQRQRVSNAPEARSICDALLAPEPGELTFEVNRQRLTGGLAVTDDEVRDAMRFAFSVLKLGVEPGGAVGLAALLSAKVDVRDGVTGVVISGGNVDPDQYAAILSNSS